MSEILQARGDDGVLTLTLNRPQQRNALSVDLIAALQAALSERARDADVACVVITGTPPAFSAGLDLNEVSASLDETGRHDATALLEMFQTIEALPIPIIAAVNGAAMAGGATLATLCDIAISSTDATFGYPGIRRGLVAPIMMPSLRRLMGEKRASYLLLTGETIDAQTALDWGLVTEIVVGERLLVRATDIARKLAAIPAATLAETKAAWRRLCESDSLSLPAPIDLTRVLRPDATK